MRIRIDQSDAYGSEPEIIIKCNQVDDKVHRIISLIDMQKKKLLGFADGKEHVIDINEVLYCESVDGAVFIYAKDQVYKTTYTLNEIEASCSEIGYFRCSKSMVLNIHAIKSLKSELGNRIDALLSNEEHIIISRHYAKQLRAILKEASKL
ncbi:LytTR family DNA-binding domain-containing protein [Anaeromicropila herbilytica]|uniref:LytTR family transcriptional regulator n=1 Tax=Anaeromicropila herbilytica TaxID=2785025 RepID=A0A7R7ICS9_9FIRM|nr:LytTR family DNA-binding domain-containing protein [Anaeromicropila herbilytica]BCN30186.1 LytTR family transcriptional regulator [Anaeromicropila herbilytica]